MNAKSGLDPIIDARSHTLILGTLPGDESIRLGQYYANPGNQFWQIIEGVYGVKIPSVYPERIKSFNPRAWLSGTFYKMQNAPEAQTAP